MESFGGQLRTWNVHVGVYEMPHWEEVPRLVNEWYSMVYGAEIYKTASEAERARIAMFLHDWFLCIHPFRDGNGRTSRLVLNMLRLRYGLSWLVIENKQKRSYYRQIERTQETKFKPQYPFIFPAYRAELKRGP
jgi:Fic family protein